MLNIGSILLEPKLLFPKIVKTPKTLFIVFLNGDSEDILLFNIANASKALRNS